MVVVEVWPYVRPKPPPIMRRSPGKDLGITSNHFVKPLAYKNQILLNSPTVLIHPMFIAEFK